MTLFFAAVFIFCFALAVWRYLDKGRVQTGLYILGSFALCGTLLAATLPSSDPVHRGLSTAQLQGYSADYLQRIATGSGVATLPATNPAHSGLSQGQLLGFQADYLQDIAAARLPIFRPETYGAIAGDATDDLPAIQAAADAAGAAGGGVVQLSLGTYRVTTVNSPATASKGNGAYGIEIPSNVTLRGASMNATSIVVVAGIAPGNGVGVGIWGAGTRTAAADYGAASFWGIEDLTISALTNEEGCGNLIEIVHSEHVTLRRVRINGCYYHGLEVDSSRHFLVQDCVFSGAYTFASSGSYVQFDNGVSGPRSTLPTATSVTYGTFERCRYLRRPDTDACARDVDMHHAAIALSAIYFIDCYFEVRNVNFCGAIDFDVDGSTIEDVQVRNCTFDLINQKTQAFRLKTSTAVVKGVRIEGCTFRGAVATSIVINQAGAAPTAAPTNANKHGIVIDECKWYWDKSTMPASTDYTLLLATQCATIQVTENKFYAYNDFPGGVVGLNASMVMRIGQNISTVVERNEVLWSGNNVTVFRVPYHITYEATDAAAGALTTQLVLVRENHIYSSGWSHGMLLTGAVSAPAGRVYDATKNYIEAAATDIIVTGAQ